MACKHEAKGNHVCEVCGLKFNHEQRLSSHYANAHKDVAFPCTVCGRTFRSRTMLISHNRAVHMGARPYKCKHCDYVASAQSKIYIHCERHYGKGNRGKSRQITFKTNFQNLFFVSGSKEDVELLTDELDRIKEIEKQQDGSRECTICQKVFSHGLKPCAHLTGDFVTNHKQLFCTICNTKWDTLSQFNVHVASVHLKAKPYKCRDCDFSTSRRAFLASHLDSSHKIKGEDAQQHIDIIPEEMAKVEDLRACKGDLTKLNVPIVVSSVSSISAAEFEKTPEVKAATAAGWNRSTSASCAAWNALRFSPCFTTTCGI